MTAKPKKEKKVRTARKNGLLKLITLGFDQCPMCRKKSKTGNGLYLYFYKDRIEAFYECDDCGEKENHDRSGVLRCMVWDEDKKEMVVKTK